MVEAWGAIGDALTDASIGYLEAINKAPDVRLARRKAELELLKLEEDTALSRARAAAAGKLKDRVISNKYGVWTYDEDTNQLKTLYEAPPVEPKYDDILKATALRGMEDIIGRPRAAWTTEDTLRLTTDPRLMKLMDVYKMRSDIVSSGAGSIPRDVARAGDQPVTSPVAPPATSAEPPAKGEPAVKVTPVNTGAVRFGKTTPEMEEAIVEAHRLHPEVRPELIRAVMARESSYNPYVTSSKGAAGLMGLMPDTGREMGVKDPFDVKDNVIGGTRYLAQQLKKYGGSEAMALAAYNAGPGRFDKGGRELAKMPPDTQAYVPWVLARAGNKAAPTSASTPAPARASTPPATTATPATSPPVEGKPAGAAAPATSTPGGFQPYRSDVQKKEDARKEEDQALQRQAMENAKEQTRISQANHDISQRRLDEELKERDRANARKDRAAVYKAEQNIVQETKDLRGQIDGAEETIALIQELRRYVTPETVGARGAATQLWQQIKGQFESPGSSRVRLTGEAAEMQRRVNSVANKHQKDAQTWQDEENSLAREQGRAPTTIYIPNYAKFDPRMTFIDYLREVVAYSQARAMNGVGRLTDQDLVHAKKALMIDDWKIPAQQMQAALGYVEKELKAKKARDQSRMEAIEKRLRKHAAGAGGEESEPAATSREN